MWALKPYYLGPWTLRVGLGVIVSSLGMRSLFRFRGWGLGFRAWGLEVGMPSLARLPEPLPACPTCAACFVALFSRLCILCISVGGTLEYSTCSHRGIREAVHEQSWGPSRYHPDRFPNLDVLFFQSFLSLQSFRPDFPL